jgi:hypothetical protein
VHPATSTTPTLRSNGASCKASFPGPPAEECERPHGIICPKVKRAHDPAKPRFLARHEGGGHAAAERQSRAFRLLRDSRHVARRGCAALGDKLVAADLPWDYGLGPRLPTQRHRRRKRIRSTRSKERSARHCSGGWNQDLSHVAGSASPATPSINMHRLDIKWPIKKPLHGFDGDSHRMKPASRFPACVP